MSYAAEMAAAAPEETPAPSAESDVQPAETNGGAAEEKEKGLGEQETEEPRSSVEPKMEEADAEAGEEKPAAAADKAASEAVTDDGGGGGGVTVNEEAKAAPEEAEQKPETQQSPGGGNSEPTTGDNTMKEAKEEPGEDSRCSGLDCEKSSSKTVCEDGEKASSGGGELGDKRRPSVEISSSDGEPLSRMDSEDRLERCGCGRVTLAVDSGGPSITAQDDN